jgi:hypothetical protein
MTRRFPPPWSVDQSPSTRCVCSIRISSATLVRDTRTRRQRGCEAVFVRVGSGFTARRNFIPKCVLSVTPSFSLGCYVFV